MQITPQQVRDLRELADELSRGTTTADGYAADGKHVIALGYLGGSVKFALNELDRLLAELDPATRPVCLARVDFDHGHEVSCGEKIVDGQCPEHGTVA